MCRALKWDSVVLNTVRALVLTPFCCVSCSKNIPSPATSLSIDQSHDPIDFLCIMRDLNESYAHDNIPCATVNPRRRKTKRQNKTVCALILKININKKVSTLETV